MAVAYDFLIDLWLGRDLPTDAAIIYGMVAWVLVATLVNTCDSVLRARNETSLLLRSMVLMAAINLPLTLLLLPQIGPAGAIWGTVTGYALALLLPYLVRLRALLAIR
jgi:O-antigen/teichoic acid export membrane protein